MTTIPAATAISQAVRLLETPPAGGCTTPGCGSQRTVQLSPVDGRRCADHATLPAGRYRPDLAADMVELGRADAAFTYLAAYLRRETNARFDYAHARLGVR